MGLYMHHSGSIRDEGVLRVQCMCATCLCSVRVQRLCPVYALVCAIDHTCCVCMLMYIPHADSG